MKKVRCKWVLGFMLGLCLLPGGMVRAKGAYQVTETDGELSVTYDDELVVDTYLSLKESSDSYKVVKPGTDNSEIYYFDSEGMGEPYSGTGFLKISYGGEKKEYYSDCGELERDKIVGSKKSGYDYVDSTGIRIKDKTVRYAVEFVTSHTSTKDSRDKKLKKCYDYLWKNYKYKRYYIGLYPKAGDMSKYAKQMFSDKKGNCHRYAACFAYIARVLGYDSQVVVGQITSRLGGMTPHGWTLVKNSGKWYVCDPDMELNGAHSYMKTYTSYRTTVTRKCTLTIKNGKVSWK